MYFRIPDRLGGYFVGAAEEFPGRMVVSAYYFVADNICFLNVLYSDGDALWLTGEPAAFTFRNKIITDAGFVELPPLHENDTEITVCNVRFEEFEHPIPDIPEWAPRVEATPFRTVRVPPCVEPRLDF